MPLQLSLLSLGFLLCPSSALARSAHSRWAIPGSAQLKHGLRASPVQGAPTVFSFVQYDDEGTGCSPAGHLALFVSGAGEVQRVQSRSAGARCQHMAWEFSENEKLSKVDDLVCLPSVCLTCASADVVHKHSRCLAACQSGCLVARWNLFSPCPTFLSSATSARQRTISACIYRRLLHTVNWSER